MSPQLSPPLATAVLLVALEQSAPRARIENALVLLGQRAEALDRATALGLVRAAADRLEVVDPRLARVTVARDHRAGAPAGAPGPRLLADASDGRLRRSVGIRRLVRGAGRDAAPSATAVPAATRTREEPAAAHPARTRRCRAGRHRTADPRDRRHRMPEPEDGGVPPDARVSEAGCPVQVRAGLRVHRRVGPDRALNVHEPPRWTLASWVSACWAPFRSTMVLSWDVATASCCPRCSWSNPGPCARTGSRTSCGPTALPRRAPR